MPLKVVVNNILHVGRCHLRLNCLDSRLSQARIIVLVFGNSKDVYRKLEGIEGSRLVDFFRLGSFTIDRTLF